MNEVVPPSRLRVVTYNVHKCRGLDRRVRPGRIAEVLREMDADVIALQEVLCVQDGDAPEKHQARFIAEALGCDYLLGENRQLNGGAYGNATLSRWPIERWRNYDLTWRDRERRGCLRADIKVPGVATNDAPLQLFNVHLGTAYLERRYQAKKLISEDVLNGAGLGRRRIVLGDFNEWTRGLATRLLSEAMESVDVSAHVGSRRTYPGLLPLLHLDHIYFDSSLRLENFALHRSRTALIASDHLPVMADFAFV